MNPPSTNRRTHHLRQALPLLLLLALGCSPGTPLPPAASPLRRAAAPRVAPATGRPAPGTLAADTRLTTASGTSFVAPKGWHVTRRDGHLALEEPDRALAVVLLESHGTDLAEAIRAGFTELDPGFARKLEKTERRPPKDGWDEIRQHEYERLTSEDRAVIGLARRKGERVYLMLIDGEQAAYDRRYAEILRIEQSFRAPGVERESWRGREALALEGARRDAFDAFVEDARVKLDVPGVAVAVVQGGRVVFEKGYGVREGGGRRPVTPDTLFMIGSITKSLTSLLMAAAVDAGAMSWDTPVRTLLPGFEVGDPELSRKMVMKNTVCACTGLPRQDMELAFEPKGPTPEARIRSLASMRPSTHLGEVFQYSNALVSAGGYATARALAPSKDLDRAFDAQLRARVLGPLGMRSSTFDFDVVARADHASPHGVDHRQTTVRVPLAMSEMTGIAPAGELWSTVRDLSRYILVELGRGRTPGGKRVASEANVLARREPQVKIGEESAYGLALFIKDVHDVRVYGHPGATLGFRAELGFVPEHDMGFVVLTNAETGEELHEAVRLKLLGLVFAGKDDEGAKHLAFAIEKRKDDAARALREVQTAVDPGWAAGLTGTYRHPGLGRVTVSARGGAVTVDAGEWRSRAGQKTESDGTRKLVLLDPPLANLELVPRADGTLLVDTPQQKYSLSPVGPPAPSGSSPVSSPTSK